MALEAMKPEQRRDIDTSVATLRSRSLSRTLQLEYQRARIEGSSPIFTPHGVRGGEWVGYLSQLLVTLVLSVAIGALFAWIPYSGEASDTGQMAIPIDPLDAYTFSRDSFARITLVLSVLVGYLIASTKCLRLRGWLITGIPMGAVLYALYYAFF